MSSNTNSAPSLPSDASKDPPETRPPAAFVSSTSLPWESSHEFGTLKWKTIFGAPNSPSQAAVTQGICELAPGAEVRRHHHAHEEAIFVISGTALVSTGYDGKYGEPRRVNPGDAIYYTSDLSHKTWNDGTEPFVCLYTFPKAALFEHVVYCYDE